MFLFIAQDDERQYIFVQDKPIIEKPILYQKQDSIFLLKSEIQQKNSQILSLTEANNIQSREAIEVEAVTLNDLRSQLSTAEKLNKILNDELSAQNKKNDDLQTEITNRNSTAEEVAVALNDLRSQLSKAEKLNKNLNDELLEQNVKNRELQTEVQIISNDMSEYKQLYERAVSNSDSISNSEVNLLNKYINWANNAVQMPQSTKSWVGAVKRKISQIQSYEENSRDLYKRCK